MRRAVLTLSLAAALAVLAAIALDGGAGLARLAADGQMAFQNALADALRALRRADPGALAVLLGLCFGYGALHAAGPGHGKVLTAGYGAARAVPVARLVGLALAASLAQATVAVVIVHGGLWLVGLGRAEVEGLEEAVLAPLSLGLIALVGLWLVWRGLRGLSRMRRSVGGRAAAGDPAPHRHDHDTAHSDACGQCGHRHGPTAAEAAAARGLREMAVLVAAIAVRPCTGALILLLLTVRMEIPGAGIAGTYAMGLGTAAVTMAVAALAALARDGALDWADRLGAARALVPLLELAAGTVVLAVSVRALMA